MLQAAINHVKHYAEDSDSHQATLGLGVIVHTLRLKPQLAMAFLASTGAEHLVLAARNALHHMNNPSDHSASPSLVRNLQVRETTGSPCSPICLMWMICLVPTAVVLNSAVVCAVGHAGGRKRDVCRTNVIGAFGESQFVHAHPHCAV